MKRILKGIFHSLGAVGAILVTINAFGYWEDFFNSYFYWVLAALWIGIAGELIFVLIEKRLRTK